MGRLSRWLLHRWWLHNLNGKFLFLLGHSQQKCVCWCSEVFSSLSQFMPTASGPVTWHRWDEPDFVFRTSSLQAWVRSPTALPLLQAEQSQFSVIPHSRCSSPLITLVALLHVSLHWGTQNYLYSRGGLISAEWKGGTTPPSPVGNIPPSAPQDTSTHHAARAWC